MHFLGVNWMCFYTGKDFWRIESPHSVVLRRFNDFDSDGSGVFVRADGRVLQIDERLGYRVLYCYEETIFVPRV